MGCGPPGSCNMGCQAYEGKPGGECQNGDCVCFDEPPVSKQGVLGCGPPGTCFYGCQFVAGRPGGACVDGECKCD